jgi:Rrf2 family transcriptional regulator, iron-sulfur cluster assembly transcription factor
MHLSRKADYALRAIRMLSRLPKGKSASINQIAEGEGIPREFLAKILKELSVKKVIVSFQGVKGGYRLVSKPKEITYLQIIEAIEGPLHISLCTEPGQTYCNRVGSCDAHVFWVKQEELLKRNLSKTNFGKCSKGSKSVLT